MFLVIRSGLVTAPLLLSLRESSELKTLHHIKLDPERALDLILKCNGPTLTRLAANRFAQRAKKRLEDTGMLTPLLENLLDTAAGRHF